MTFLIADTFTDSLARLTGDEQKAVKTTAFDLQMDPSAPGLSFHKLDKAKDKRFWSVRVSSDIRLIVHSTDTSLLLCYVDHHDRAYAWAERRKLETHPDDRRGADDRAPRDGPGDRRPGIRAEAAGGAQAIDEAARRDFGRAAARIRRACRVAERRSSRPTRTGCSPWPSTCPRKPPRRFWSWRRAARRTCSLRASGAPVPRSVRAPRCPAPFPRRDQRRGTGTRARCAVGQVDGLPAPRAAPTGRRDEYAGPARVAGSAGTGKTVVALHRAVHLARANPDGRILLATFSEPLAHALRANVKRLIGNEPRVAERLEVHSMSSLGLRLHQAQLGPVRLASKRGRRRAAARGIAGRRRAQVLARCSCAPNGTRSSMPGSSVPGRPIATSSASAAGRVCRKPGERCCGRSSSRCARA